MRAEKRTIQYTLLAKSIPEYSKRDGSLYTCSIGYSPGMGLIRVYPLPIKGMDKWGCYQIEVERNRRDSRPESWKLSSYTKKEGWVGFEKEATFIGRSKPEYIIPILTANVSPSISRLNEQRKSIGVIKTNSLNPHWDLNKRFINSGQIGMFDDVELAEFTSYTKETKQKECRLIFSDEDGVHNMQFNEWQYYEYQRRHGASKDAFRFIDTQANNLILVGNMHNYRNKWIALGVFKMQAVAQTFLFH